MAADGAPSQHSRRTVVIIGGGFSGACLSAHLLREKHSPRVILIERGRRLGRGLAYGGDDPSHLLNVPASGLSALQGKPEHFLNWLRRRDKRATGASFAPRQVFGRYVEDTLRAAAGRRWLRFKAVRGEAIACRRDGERWKVSLARGGEIEADAVVLALGHPPAQQPPVFDVAEIELLAPFDRAALRRIPAKGDVLLLGAGLTMVDAALTLSRWHKGTLYALSRRGVTPRAHAPSGVAPDSEDPPLPLSDALYDFRKRAEGEPGWRAVIDEMRPKATRLWMRLSVEAQRRFLRHLRPWWDAHRHRMAPQVDAQFAALKESGRLRLLSGEIVGVTRNGRGIQVMHRQRGSHARHRLDVVAVVNCTGADMDVRRWDAPLMQQLLADGLIQPNSNGVGICVNANGQSLVRDVAQAGLYALGPTTQGAFWEATAIQEIRVRAAELAHELS